MDAAQLFPGPLEALYEEFAAGVRAEGHAVEAFTRTQVSFAVARKFAWLVPLTTRKGLVLLDMYEAHTSPLFRDVITYRADKHTHQIEVTDPGTIRQASAAGWFHQAYLWGAKTPPTIT